MLFFLSFFVYIVVSLYVNCVFVCLLGCRPQCPTVLFHLKHSSLFCVSFSHSGSHTYRFVHFPSCKTDISSSYITRIKWGMWQGQMKRRRKMRVLFTTYLSDLYELWRSTSGWQGWYGLVSVGCSLVGWVCSPCCTIYLLHCLLGISLSICLSVCLLALACFSLLPPLKQGFLGCCDSHVILACCTRQASAPVLCTPQPRCSPASIQMGLQLWHVSGAHYYSHTNSFTHAQRLDTMCYRKFHIYEKLPC